MLGKDFGKPDTTQQDLACMPRLLDGRVYSGKNVPAPPASAPSFCRGISSAYLCMEQNNLVKVTGTR